MKNEAVVAQTESPAEATSAPKHAEPRVIQLPYMGDEDSYNGGLTVSIPSSVLSSRDGTGLNGQAYSFH